ncbi:hypothetical protein GCM10011507_34970 [Edaphobacter acidisoli]|uniref:Phage portal protein n=1 Tax=Edaphobacter acidisoli TaxID=2040573 RepID=A0A916S1Z7_9BACT|nr:phage portal protein [Edaphobacter acidisoli]GGA80761.1 hypothetical protein GCM10011507_34970 [Edaphobacter acidisoli]
MNLIESIFRGGLRLRADVGGAPAPWDDFWYEPAGGQESSAGMRVTPETSKRLAMVLACVSVRGKMIAIQPFKIRTDLVGGGSRTATEHPLYELLYSRPNPVQTAYDFRYMMNAHVDLRGNAYALKVPGPDGFVSELWPLHPDRVKVEVLPKTRRPIYVYDNPLTNQTERFVQEEIFHLRDWSDSIWLGQSRIRMGVDVMGLALARQDYTARWLKNDARTGLVFSGGNFKTKDDELDFIRSVQAGNAGKHRGRAMMLPLGMDAKSLSVTPVDGQLLEGGKYSDTQICSIMGVLPHMVGIDSGKAATFASTEQFNIMNAQYTVHPMNIMWEQAVQRDLLADSRFYAKLSMAAFLRGDNATRFAGYATAIQNSWMCPDDVRELEDLNPIPNGQGKLFWRSANLLPLSQLVAPSQIVKSAPDDPESDDDASDDGAGSGTPDAATMAATRGRLELLAAGAADRCVRKEVSAVRRMIDGDAGFAEASQFYVEHTRFIADVFHMEASVALMVKIACDARAQHLALLLADEEDETHSAALEWIEHVAATEPRKLAALAVEGVQ